MREVRHKRHRVSDVVRSENFESWLNYVFDTPIMGGDAPTVADDHTMKTRDELDDEYREGWKVGDKERRESDKRGLVEGLAHEAADMGLMIGTMGLSHLHELGRSDAFKAGHLAGRRGESCDPDSFIEEMEEKEAERQQAELAKQREEEMRERRRAKEDAPSSGDSTNDLIGSLVKLGLWLGAIMFVLWLAFMALAITVMLLPLWLGGVAAGVIAGFILANKIASNLSEELLARVPIWVEEKKKIRRYRIAQDFFKDAIKLNPHMLVLVGVTFAYGVAMASWPFLSTSEIFNRVLLGVGVAAGTILGTVAGRRILSGQLENGIFERAQSDAPTRLHGPKVALGFAVPGVLLLAGFWAAALFETRGNVNFAKSFGMESEKPARQRIAESPIERTTQPSPAKSTTARSQRTTPIQTDDLNPLLFDNYKAFVNSERSEFVVELDWMVRLGAIQWIAPISGLAFDQARRRRDGRRWSIQGQHRGKHSHSLGIQGDETDLGAGYES